MKIAVGADHAGYELKDQLAEALRKAGHEVTDFGTNSGDSTDYPDYARSVAESVVSGKADRGVLVCGSGVGMEIAANKVHGARAANIHSVEEAALSRQHNNANVLTMGARFIAPALAQEMVDTFLQTDFEGGRHERRVGKIADIETHASVR